ncbi:MULTISPECIES: MBL fold metallo-hydrolase [unclassified Neglectibacter]|uniref:MBL fold metallo-hydrolase n=1 Tax=unclassified Neglectibacter TaxID=2632164 RepID=UPI00136AACFB|nr:MULTISPECIES: MBL fold metallo-hydrolase [unclassified Neglectibacter]
MKLTTKPTVTELGYGVYSINCMGMQAPLLIVGTERALLLDTGIGNCNIRTIGEELTDLPITVALTHEHGDHIGGICQFDEVLPRSGNWKPFAGSRVNLYRVSWIFITVSLMKVTEPTTVSSSRKRYWPGRKCPHSTPSATATALSWAGAP